MRSMLSNLTVYHRCRPEEEAKKYKYDELKKHILTQCPAFRYDCRLCIRALKQKTAEVQIQKQIQDLNAGREAFGEEPVQFNLEDMDKQADVIEVGRDKLNDPIKIRIEAPRGN
jgi:hypothetical protein